MQIRHRRFDSDRSLSTEDPREVPDLPGFAGVFVLMGRSAAPRQLGHPGPPVATFCRSVVYIGVYIEEARTVRLWKGLVHAHGRAGCLVRRSPSPETAPARSPMVTRL